MVEAAPPDREGPLKPIDFLYFFEDSFPAISYDEQIKIRNISIDLSALARSLGEEEAAIEFEQSMRYWVSITRTITGMKRLVNTNVFQGDRWDVQCNDFKKIPSSQALTTITKVYLSEPDKQKFDSFTSEAALYARYMDVRAALDDILRLYKQKRTRFQSFKNTVGGVEGKVNALREFLSRIYEILLPILLRTLALSTCTPPSLKKGEALFLYTPELDANFKKVFKTPNKPSVSTIPSSRETSRGYVPGRGYLMVHKNTGAYRYSPREEDDTGGVPTQEEVQAFFADRSPAQSTLTSSVTMRPSEAAPTTVAPGNVLPSIAESNETNENENQEGGRRKTRKTRKTRHKGCKTYKGRKGTRKH